MFTVKKLYPEPHKRNSLAYKIRRKEFAQWLSENFQNYHFIWIDETGFDLHLSRSRGRAKIGQRARASISNAKGKHQTYTMAVSAVNGLVHHAHKVGGVGQEDFKEFMWNLCQKLAILQSELPFALMIDNAPAHNGVEVFLEEFNFSNVLVKRISPYSPELNAVEHCFSIFKSSLKEKLRQFGPVELAKEPEETLRSCRDRVLYTLSQEALSSLTIAKISGCQTSVLVRKVAEALQMKDM